MKRKLTLEGLKNFDLKQIFECGQCFRYKAELDGSYTVVANNQIVNFKMEGNSVNIDNITADEFYDFWYDYFDLDRDYDQIIREISKNDKVIQEVAKVGSGIRILNQNPWETLISFIISSNNNIPRIQGCIEALCNNFGKRIGEYRGIEYFTFPEPKDIAKLDISDLDCCRLGYRSKYILETSKQVMAMGMDNFFSLRDKTFDEVITQLNDFMGVGPKVAHCIALFGFGKTEAFPIDVWMKKVMAELYGMDENDVKAMYLKGMNDFGRYAGIAQQYLFYFMRQPRAVRQSEVGELGVRGEGVGNFEFREKKEVRKPFEQQSKMKRDYGYGDSFRKNDISGIDDIPKRPKGRFLKKSDKKDIDN